MKLTIEHLAPYLPYGLQIKDYQNNGLIVKMVSRNKTVSLLGGHEILDVIEIDELKPILRPLSDLTKEIEHDEESFVPVEMIFGTKKEDRSIQVVDHLYKFKEGLIHRQHIQYWIILLLFEWHFDVFNLIENNLAIDINKI
jgi:hypothetical protein